MSKQIKTQNLADIILYALVVVCANLVTKCKQNIFLCNIDKHDMQIFFLSHIQCYNFSPSGIYILYSLHIQVIKTIIFCILTIK